MRPDLFLHDPWRHRPPPDLDEFAEMAGRAHADLPQPFRGLARDVEVRVAEEADAETLASVGLAHPLELCGLYEGVDLHRRSVLGPAPINSRVTLYRRAILQEWAQTPSVTLEELVGHVLVHEFGHHFGLSDEDMHRIEDE